MINRCNACVSEKAGFGLAPDGLLCIKLCCRRLADGSPRISATHRDLKVRPGGLGFLTRGFRARLRIITECQA